MTIRFRHRGVRPGAAVVAAVAAAAVLAACSDSSQMDGLSASGLRDKVRTAPKEGKNCPLDYDLDKAAASAHVSGHAEPDSAIVALPEDADKGAVLRTANATDVECDYRLGSETVSVETVAAEKGDAGNLLAPVIQRNAHMSTTQLEAYLPLTQKAPSGSPVLTPTGNVALVRLRADGKDSVVVLVSFGVDEDTHLTSSQVRTISGELASQASW